MVPKAGFEPARVFPTTPSRWRVYQVPPLRHRTAHLAGGAAGVCGPEDGAGGGVSGWAGAAGTLWLTGGLAAPRITEASCWRPRKVNPSEVTMKRMAATAVNLARNGAAPVEPKTVWLEPPKAAPMPAPLPCCKRTIKIKASETMTWTMTAMVVITL